MDCRLTTDSEFPVVATEDVAVPVNDALLPGRIRKELCGALGQPNEAMRIFSV
jgi:hypothetical protein